MKFNYDFGKILLSEEGEKIVNFFKEYLTANDVLKEAIMLLFKTKYKKYAENLDNIKDIDIFKKNLVKEKKYCGDVSDDIFKEAIIFIDKCYNSKDNNSCCDYLLIKGKENDSIIIRRLIGIKSSIIKEFFDMNAFSQYKSKNNKDECLVSSYVFKQNKEFFELFVNSYLLKKINNWVNDTVLKELEKKKKIKTYIGKLPANRFIDIYIDCEIKYENLSSELLFALFNILSDLTLEEIL